MIGLDPAGCQAKDQGGLMNASHPWVGRMRAAALATLVGCGPLALTLPAEDWPQWRGPGREGRSTETNLLSSFPPGGLIISWRRPIGPGWSSPAVAQGRVFVSDSKPFRPTAQERLHCLETATGQTLWTYSFEVAYPEWAFDPVSFGGPSATPLVETDKVYMAGSSGHIHCLETRQGIVVWKVNLNDTYHVPVLQCRPSPLIEGNLLIMAAGANPGACLLALDKNTGQEVWKALDEPVSNSSPLVIEAGGKRQLIVWTGSSVTSLDPATGMTFWRERLVTSNNDAIASPVLHKNLLLISGLMFQLNAEEPSASILWPEARGVSKRILSNTSTPVLSGDHVYSARSSGELVCLEAATGRQVWQTNSVTDLKSGASIHLTPASPGMFLFNDQGELILAKLTPQGYREISRGLLVKPTSSMGNDKRAWVPPAYANGHVFARNDEEIVCADLRESR
jgi:outer membrane protein assembly factor BamB